MTRYIALLRGINIGGHQVKMERLRELFTELGLENVRSYIQTGNVFFDTPETDRPALQQRIEAHLEKALDYKVPTFLRTVEEFEHIFELDPFADYPLTPETRHMIFFLAGQLASDIKFPHHLTPAYEVVGATPGEAFCIRHLVNGRPVGLSDKALGTVGTSRFYHTAIKILEAARA